MTIKTKPVRTAKLFDDPDVGLLLRITEHFPREVVPNKITFLDHLDASLLQNPLWLAINRQLSDVEPITSESSTTNQPIDEVVDWALLVAYEDLSGADFDEPTWGAKYRKALQRTGADIATAPPPAKLRSQVRNRVGWR